MITTFSPASRSARRRPRSDVVELPLWKKSQKILSGEDLLGVWSSDEKHGISSFAYGADLCRPGPVADLSGSRHPRDSSPSAKAILRFELQEVTASAGHVVVEPEPRSIRLAPANTADNEIPDREYPIAPSAIPTARVRRGETDGQPAPVDRPLRSTSRCSTCSPRGQRKNNCQRKRLPILCYSDR